MKAPTIAKSSAKSIVHLSVLKVDVLDQRRAIVVIYSVLAAAQGQNKRIVWLVAISMTMVFVKTNVRQC